MATKLPINQRQRAFACLVARGKTLAEAYAALYSKRSSHKTCKEKGSRLAKDPRIKAEIQRLYAKSDVKTVLSFNERLDMMATTARRLGSMIKKAKKPGEVATAGNAQARVIEVYSRISGDQAPERHEIAGKDGSPIHVAVTATVTRLSVKDRIAALREARKNEATSPGA